MTALRLFVKNVSGKLTHWHSGQSPRFEGLIRPYTAEQVVNKRGTLPIQYPSNVQAKKLHKLLSQHAKDKTPSHTYGACVSCV